MCQSDSLAVKGLESPGGTKEGTDQDMLVSSLFSWDSPMRRAGQACRAKGA